MEKLNVKKLILVSMPIVFAVALAIILAACMAQAERSTEDGLFDPPKTQGGVGDTLSPTVSSTYMLEYRRVGDGKCEVSGPGSFKGGNLVIPAKSPDGDTVVGIGDSAFLGVASLKSAELPTSIGYIGAYAFYGSSLEAVELPDGVDEIGECAFSNCRALTRIDVGSGNASYTDMDGVLYSRDKSEIVCYPSGRANSSFTVRAGVTVIHKMAFYGCAALRSVNYNGTEEAWSKVKIGTNNDSLTSLTVKFSNSDK
ncbi:MAG: leucine-rich repeat domain-containing protein [Clostridia bacterium]|nr:leucine-rich repeat domain-containing protein [Clostridia bacterium]